MLKITKHPVWKKKGKKNILYKTVRSWPAIQQPGAHLLGPPRPRPLPLPRPRPLPLPLPATEDANKFTVNNGWQVHNNHTTVLRTQPPAEHFWYSSWLFTATQHPKCNISQIPVYTPTLPDKDMGLDHCELSCHYTDYVLTQRRWACWIFNSTSHPWQVKDDSKLHLITNRLASVSHSNTSTLVLF